MQTTCEQGRVFHRPDGTMQPCRRAAGVSRLLRSNRYLSSTNSPSISVRRNPKTASFPTPTAPVTTRQAPAQFPEPTTGCCSQFHRQVFATSPTEPRTPSRRVKSPSKSAAGRAAQSTLAVAKSSARFKPAVCLRCPLQLLTFRTRSVRPERLAFDFCCKELSSLVLLAGSVQRHGFSRDIDRLCEQVTPDIFVQVCTGDAVFS